MIRRVASTRSRVSCLPRELPHTQPGNTSVATMGALLTSTSPKQTLKCASMWGTRYSCYLLNKVKAGNHSIAARRVQLALLCSDTQRVHQTASTTPTPTHTHTHTQPIRENHGRKRNVTPKQQRNAKENAKTKLVDSSSSGSGSSSSNDMTKGSTEPGLCLWLAREQACASKGTE